MSNRGTRALIALVGALVVAGAAGCSGAAPPPSAPPPPPPTRPGLPSRPVELRLDGLDPCKLLTGDQKRQLNIASGSPVMHDAGPIQGPACLWRAYGFHPDNGWTGSAVLNHGADYALGSEPLRSLDGFAAATTTSTGSDPDYYCGVMVDVAPGQALEANYSNNAHDVPGMNREMACENAMRLASAMLVTLRTIERR